MQVCISGFPYQVIILYDVIKITQIKFQTFDLELACVLESYTYFYSLYTKKANSMSRRYTLPSPPQEQDDMYKISIIHKTGKFTVAPSNQHKSPSSIMRSIIIGLWRWGHTANAE